MSEEWYYVGTNNSQCGPVTQEQLKQCYTQQQINNETLVWNANMNGWESIATQIELMKYLNPPKPAVVHQPTPAPATQHHPHHGHHGQHGHAQAHAQAQEQANHGPVAPAARAHHGPVAPQKRK
jgi:hypothetical protein